MKIRTVFELIGFYAKDFLGIRSLPRVIQLPVTANCNSRCLTCNIWQDADRTDIDTAELKRIFAEKFFTKVETVGVNGGEISLYKSPHDLFDALIMLPRLKNIYLISNGLLQSRLIALLSDWKKLCSEKGVKLNVTISVDGYGEVHNYVRGIPNAFKRTIDTIKAIQQNKYIYCDALAIGCTISKHNIQHISEIEIYLRSLGLPVSYHLAVPNKRIGTFVDFPYFVLENQECLYLATEYFFKKTCSIRRLSEKFRYFAQYYYLRNNGKYRLSICPYLKQDITIDEHLNLYLCATASDKISNLRHTTVEESMKSKELKAVEKQVSNCCDNCVHYMSGIPTIKGWFIFVKYIIHNRLKYNYIYKYLSIWQRL